MKDIIVSFCIASFRRYEILKELILEILSVDSDQFEIVVCDNCSSDGTVEKLENIHDQRLRIFVNDMNVGSLQNIYEALEHGRGRYLFYVNDRDNVDALKIRRLISILEELDKKNVAFIRCIGSTGPRHHGYQIFSAGEDAILQFGCRISHPTGYIFRKNVWSKVKKRKNFFTKQCYGDYPVTIICAIMALRYSGANIWGDICDVKRKRIDFSKEKSRYYEGRKDKNVWYSPAVQWREWQIAYYVLKKISIGEKVIDEMLYLRYREYLKRITLQYEQLIADPVNTIHYNLRVPQDTISIYITAIQNGLYFWRRVQQFCRNKNKKELLKKIRKCTLEIYKDFLIIIYKHLLGITQK